MGEEIIMEQYKRKFEEASDIYKYADTLKKASEIRSIIHKIGQDIEWDIDAARSICLHILEDVNDHKMMSRVEKLFDRFD